MASSNTSLNFCTECNNLLSPRSDPTRRVMILWCRSCGAEEEAVNRVVYRNDLLTVTKEQAGVTQDIETDPTLPHSNIECPKCQSHDAVFYQDQSKRTETRMILFYVCSRCKHNFFDPSLKSKGVEISAADEEMVDQ